MTAPTANVAYVLTRPESATEAAERVIERDLFTEVWKPFCAWKQTRKATITKLFADTAEFFERAA